MKTTVRRPPASSSRRASSTASRNSAIPADTAAIVRKPAPERRASNNAIVVLPLPGGPHRIIDGSAPAASIRPEHLVGAEQMLLADHLVEAPRAHPVRQRLRRRRPGREEPWL